MGWVGGLGGRVGGWVGGWVVGGWVRASWVGEVYAGVPRVCRHRCIHRCMYIHICDIVECGHMGFRVKATEFRVQGLYD